MQSKGFDDAPVVDDGAVVGIIATEALEALYASKLILTAKNADSRRQRFLDVLDGTYLDVADLFDRLSEVRSAVLTRTGEDRSEPLGFITISDLNRQAVRAVIYEILAGLEADLAFLVQHFFPEPWDWVQHLNEDAQVRVLGYWDLAKRRGVDVGPIAAATLTQLLHVAGRSAPLRTRLGFSTKGAFEEQSGRLPDLRNRVMHPVRPLVLDLRDAKVVSRALGSALRLAVRARSAE